MSHEFCDVGASRLDKSTGALLVQCKSAPVAEDGTAPDYGAAPYFCGLGEVAIPWPADDDGSAEAIIATDVPGMDGAVVGMRDVRIADIVGNMEPGDKASFSVGPQKSAMSLYRERKRQVLHRTKDSRGKDVVILMDGTNDKVQIAAFGLAFEMSREQGFVMSDGGATIQVKGGVIALTGTVVLGGRNPTLPVLAGASGPAGVATPGVFVGS